MKDDWLKPIIGKPKSICTETYVLFGPFKSKQLMENAFTYTQTKFFHFFMGMKKITQDATSKVYSLVPIQDFSKPWTDEELYKKYDLSKEEIDFIESMVKPMD
jgi:site-specific DNA-methyltransferase (adenine-specific)